ncbi:DUF424 domain-containing protein [Halorussus pelagicus]|uniref:DUF424 domain-containing protein n=1 Tax=Halorussus pelagicus TaxID=2505977 RepID=UPI000FFC6F2C|nr:DUF424 domain-containing protein [Halorussus pelagicus]
MILNERRTDEGLLVAVCDDDVLGETFEDDGVSMTVTEEFYGGEEADEQAVVDSLARASVANLVGTEAVELAIREGFVDEENVLDVESTRHAQFVRM